MTEPSNKARWSNPLTAAIVAAALAGFSNAIIAYENNRALLELETVKAESARILEVLRIGEPGRVRENLRFLLQLGLVRNEDLRRRIEAWEANPRRGSVYLGVLRAGRVEPLPDSSPLAGTRTSREPAETEGEREPLPAEPGGY